jgi:hypothetical protein
MAIPVVLQSPTRKRGNPAWGRPVPPARVLPTEFEMQARRLRLTKEMYVSSRELRLWCAQNRNRVYVPEWLLQEWHMTVEPSHSGAV